MNRDCMSEVTVTIQTSLHSLKLLINMNACMESEHFEDELVDIS